MQVNICGIKYDVIECEDVFNADSKHFGQIDFLKGKITVNKELSEPIKKETICHEMVHGILTHLGYIEQSQDEQFVQALGNAIAQGFEVIDATKKDNERLLLLEEILKRGDCNTCGKRKDCEYAPKLGEIVRYNCPFFTAKNVT